MCAIRVDSIPFITELFCGELCVVNDNELCNEVHINAEGFVVNPKFACRFKASMQCGVTRTGGNGGSRLGAPL